MYEDKAPESVWARAPRRLWTGDGLGVVLHHADGDGDRERGSVVLTALDLATGTARWSRRQGANRLGLISEYSRSTALGGGRTATAYDGADHPVLRHVGAPARARARGEGVRAARGALRGAVGGERRA